MNRLLSVGFLFVAAIVLISIATKYSRGVAFRSQDLPADEAGYPAETLKEIYGILFARWIVKNSVVSHCNKGDAP